MEIVQSIKEIQSKGRKIGLTIGNFDGLHLGHRYILEKIKKECVKKNQIFVVMTFIPHPKKILGDDQRNFLINNYSDRRELCATIGIDYLIELPFNRDFSLLEPKEFLDKYVFVNKYMNELFIGHDFAFGSNKSGTHEIVMKLCGDKKIKCEIQDEFIMNGKVLSSTLIRDLINSGQIDEAKGYLGREYFITGTVVRGVGRGRLLGFPTANLKFNPELIYPGNGVYVTKTFYDSKVYKSMTNVGINPTFENDQIVRIETNLLDFDKEIYGEKLKICFLKRLRDEIKFDGTVNFTNQLENDLRNTLEYFND